jgi:hypothetical protein
LLLHLKLSNPLLILPDRIRVDKGTETRVMVTIHSYLRDKVGDVDDATRTVLYDPSIQNKIERWGVSYFTD